MLNDRPVGSAGLTANEIVPNPPEAVTGVKGVMVLPATTLLVGTACVVVRGTVEEMVPIALATEGVPQGTVGATTIIAMAFFAIFATAFAYLLYYRVLALAGSGNLGLVTLFVPVVAIVLGTLVLGERLSHGVFAGFGLLVLGMIILDGRLWRALSARFSV